MIAAPMFVLNDQIGFNVHRVALLMRRELTKALKPHSLSVEQWQILATLWQQGSLTQSQIMEVTLQDAPSASRTIVRLVRKRLVTKALAKGDKRATLITLTHAGKKLRESIPKIVLGHFEQFLKSIAEKDRASLLRILKQFRQLFGDKI